MMNCQACESPSESDVCATCEAEAWIAEDRPAELGPAPFPGPAFDRWKRRAAVLASAAALVVLAVPVLAAIMPRAEVAGTVAVASVAPESLALEGPEAEIEETTTTSTTLAAFEEPEAPFPVAPVTTTTTAPKATGPPAQPPAAPPTTEPPAPSVPDVVGRTEAEAVAALDGYGVIITRQPGAAEFVGIVIRQNGAALTIGEPLPIPEVPEEVPEEVPAP